MKKVSKNSKTPAPTQPDTKPRLHQLSFTVDKQIEKAVHLMNKKNKSNPFQIYMKKKRKAKARFSNYNTLVFGRDHIDSPQKENMKLIAGTTDSVKDIKNRIRI